MNRMLITATNTMSQLQKKIDVIGSNLGNAETTGYKAKESYFNDLLYQHFNNQPRADKERGRLTANGIQMGVGAQLGLLKVNTSQGSFKETGRDLDVALTKRDLFFKVSVDGEVQYTRDGAFYLSPGLDGGYRLVTSSGHFILDENNEPISFHEDVQTITFGDRGTVSATLSSGVSQPFELGIVSVQNPQYMEQKSANVYGIADALPGVNVEADDVLTALDGALRQNISIRQGALEASNVDMAKEMTDLITVQRQYQMQSRSVTIADQMQGLINGVR
ncbi:MAG: flagellar hook-basal body protein [Bacillus sp. (in: firmicutes)]